MATLSRQLDEHSMDLDRQIPSRRCLVVMSALERLAGLLQFKRRATNIVAGQGDSRPWLETWHS